MRAARQAWEQLLRQLAAADRPATFDAASLAGAPEPVRRYFSASITDGTPLAPAAELTMRGAIRLGRWLPFRARQLLAPGVGTVWTARVGGVLSGFDSYVADTGRMDWRLLGAMPVSRAEGADVTRSAAGRVAGESVWVPTAVVPGACDWRVEAASTIGTRLGPPGTSTELHHEIDTLGLVRRSWFDRWGDPTRSGTWAMHPFRFEARDHGTFGGVTIPTAGEVGWGADPFFRFQIDGYRLVR